MPRDGFEIYNVPSGTHGSPDTTIESAKYNSFVDDIALDLNYPRPILSGGTGGNDAIEAMTNLNGEISRQAITNFDSDHLYPGSFYCATTATGSPVTGHAFQGWIYVTDNTNMVVQARDNSDASSPGRLYVREKRAGVWSAWKVDGRNIIGDAEGIASDSGDMFFGIKGVAPNSRFIVNSKADVTGTDILSAPKAGGLVVTGTLGTTGIITSGSEIVANQGATPSVSGIVRFGTSSTNYLQYNLDHFEMGGGRLAVLNGRIDLPNATSYILGDGANIIHRTSNASIFQNASGVQWGYFSAGGLTMNVGGISTPGSVSASGNVSGNVVVAAAYFLCTSGAGIIYLNGSTNRYLQFDGSNYRIPSSYIYNDGAAGRLWGTNDFGGVPVNNGRLAYVTDYQVGYGVSEPWNGAVITGAATVAIYRWRYMQLFTTGWFTCGYA